MIPTSKGTLPPQIWDTFEDETNDAEKSTSSFKSTLEKNVVSSNFEIPTISTSTGIKTSPHIHTFNFGHSNRLELPSSPAPGSKVAFPVTPTPIIISRLIRFFRIRPIISILFLGILLVGLLFFRNYILTTFYPSIDTTKCVSADAPVNTMDAFVISLYESRYAVARTQLACAGITSVSHAVAVHGREWLAQLPSADTDASALITLPARFALQLDDGTCPSGCGLPSAGAAGLYLSHLSVWERIRAENKTALVFEEDVSAIIPAFTTTKLLNLWEDAKGVDWDVMLLDAKVLRPTTDLTPITSSFARLRGDFWFTSAYAITPRGADRLLSRALPMHVQIDRYMASAAALDVTRTFVATPTIFRQHKMWRSSVQRTTVFDRAIWHIQDFFRTRTGFFLLIVFILGFCGFLGRSYLLSIYKIYFYSGSKNHAHMHT